MNLRHSMLAASVGLGLAATAVPAFADGNSCASLPSWGRLQSALAAAVAASGNGGLGFNMWATLVANDGTVCAVAFSGDRFTDQWLGSRVISAQKANTANDFSLSKGAPPKSSLFPNGLALSTANLYSAVQPGGSLYGLQHSNPVDPAVAYQGDARRFGTPFDPLVGQRSGGVNVFGGGLALYKTGGAKIGAVGVSGDQSCTDHFVAWHVRHNLKLDFLAGIGPVPGDDAAHPDNIIFDITANPNGGTGISKSGFGHPTCVNTGDPSTLPAVQ
ncbi:MAG TPA: heme-binding protein [Stellaceae bacterium]